jgi:hypothetical protein
VHVDGALAQAAGDRLHIGGAVVNIAAWAPTDDAPGARATAEAIEGLAPPPSGRDRYVLLD